MASYCDSDKKSVAVVRLHC